jgi:hypothetical protein
MATLRRTLYSISLFGLISCGGDTTNAGPADHSLHGIDAAAGGGSSIDKAGLEKVVHALSARFHSKVQAQKAGYVEDTFCVASPDGGMGYHWVNEALVDPAFDPLKPEVMLYSPDAKGKPRLAAVEYIVIDVGQDPPTFEGHPFDVGGTPVPVPHWSLHVWVHRDNPSGVFAPWNPDVSCPDPT